MGQRRLRRRRGRRRRRPRARVDERLRRGGDLAHGWRPRSGEGLGERSRRPDAEHLRERLRSGQRRRGNAQRRAVGVRDANREPDAGRRRAAKGLAPEPRPERLELGDLGGGEWLPLLGLEVDDAIGERLDERVSPLPRNPEHLAHPLAQGALHVVGRVAVRHDVGGQHADARGFGLHVGVRALGRQVVGGDPERRPVRAVLGGHRLGVVPRHLERRRVRVGRRPRPGGRESGRGRTQHEQLGAVDGGRGVRAHGRSGPSVVVRLRRAPGRLGRGIPARGAGRAPLRPPAVAPAPGRGGQRRRRNTSQCAAFAARMGSAGYEKAPVMVARGGEGGGHGSADDARRGAAPQVRRTDSVRSRCGRGARCGEGDRSGSTRAGEASLVEV